MKLNLAQNEITSKGIQSLKNILPLSKIKDLNLSKNYIKNKGIRCIGDLLGNGSVFIETLILQNCHFDSLGSYYLYEGVKKNSKLKVLSLDDNNLQGKSLHALSVALWTSSGLVKLSLERC